MRGVGFMVYHTFIVVPDCTICIALTFLPVATASGVGDMGGFSNFSSEQICAGSIIEAAILWKLAYHQMVRREGPMSMQEHVENMHRRLKTARRRRARRYLDSCTLDLSKNLVPVTFVQNVMEQGEIWFDLKPPLISPLGLKWYEVGSQYPTSDTEIFNNALVVALREKTEFTNVEWDSFKVLNLQLDCYITVDGRCFKPAETKQGVPVFIGTYPATALTLWACATIQRMLPILGIPCDYRIAIVDIIPYLHPTRSGLFLFDPSIASNTYVKAWFVDRIEAVVIKIGAAGYVPVLYVADQNWATFSECFQFVCVNNMPSGYVFKGFIQGVEVTIVHGRHPSPSSHAGHGYGQYIHDLTLWKACLLNPGDPGAAWTFIKTADSANVENMIAFF